MVLVVVLLESRTSALIVFALLEWDVISKDTTCTTTIVFDNKLFLTLLAYATLSLPLQPSYKLEKDRGNSTSKNNNNGICTEFCIIILSVLVKMSFCCFKKKEILRQGPK